MTEFDIGKKIVEIMGSEDFRKLDPQGVEKKIATSALAAVRTFYTMLHLRKTQEAFDILDGLYKNNSYNQGTINTWLKKIIGETKEYREYVTYKTGKILNRNS
ncbi:MAG TPA: hypothetical protein VI894_03645 [Candidatus Nanoarchaeia archaeon]|nr:hypothetical protein [Candidatus Nanoarchaeia archaeon]